MSYEKEQEKWIEKYNIKVGYRLKITRKASDYEKGWDNGWVTPMDENIGQIVKIPENFNRKNSGIRLNSYYDYPYFVLEPIDKINNKPAKTERWHPKIGDRVWYIAIGASIVYYDMIYQEYHKTMFKNGLIFRTREQARKVVREIKNIL